MQTSAEFWLHALRKLQRIFPRARGIDPTRRNFVWRFAGAAARSFAELADAATIRSTFLQLSDRNWARPGTQFPALRGPRSCHFSGSTPPRLPPTPQRHPQTASDSSLHGLYGQRRAWIGPVGRGWARSGRRTTYSRDGLNWSEPSRLQYRVSLADACHDQNGASSSSSSPSSSSSSFSASGLTGSQRVASRRGSPL